MSSANAPVGLISRRGKLNAIKKHIGKTEVFVLALVFLVLLYAVFCAERHCLKAFALCMVCIALVGGFWAWYRWLSIRCENAVARFIFPVALVALGLISAFFLPAGSVPDEFLHYFRSYEYASVLMGWNAHTVRAEDLCAFVVDGGFLSRDIGIDGWNYVRDHFDDSAVAGTVALGSLSDVNPQALADVGLFTELPQLRLFPAFGIALGRILGLNHVIVFYLGRLFNMLFGATLVVLAVRTTPIGKNVMMIIALFPMTIQLIGSYSYDSGTIGLAFLCTALALKIAFGEKSLSVKTLTAFFVVTALMAPCKPVYLVLAYIALFVPCGCFSSRKNVWVFRIAIAVVPVIAVALTRLGDVSGVVSDSSSNGVSYFSMSTFFSDPSGSFMMLVNTVEALGSFWLQNISGDSLGWFQENTSFPDYVSYFLLFVLFLGSIRSYDDGVEVPIVVRCGFVVLFFIGASGVVLSMWLSWTTATEVIIQGVQGRYFIPLLPMLMLAVRPNGIKANYSFSFPLVVCTFSTTLCGFAYIAVRCLAV